MAMNVHSGKDSETMNTNIDIDDMGLDELYDLLEKIRNDLIGKEEDIEVLVPVPDTHIPAYNLPFETFFWEGFLDNDSKNEVKLSKAREIGAEAQRVILLENRVVTRIIGLENIEQAKRQN